MKKYLLLMLFILLLPAGSAMAKEAEDITAKCVFTVESKAWTAERLYDRDWNSYWNGNTGGKTVTIRCPAPAWGLYLCWMEEPEAWTLEQKVNGAWLTAEYPAEPFMHQYVPLLGAEEIRLKPAGKSVNWFGLEEIFVLGSGEVPPYVQQWQQPDDSCDLLVFFAHPDDETLFFGGTIPVYAGEKRLDVVACSLSSATRTRRSELLNSLWTMGMRNYPVFGPFHDSYSLKLDKAYAQFGETRVKGFVTELFRRYQPRVVVTQDLNGEYGHGMHRMCADASLYAFDAAADADRYPITAQQYGTFEVSKLYLHLYPENALEMDWDRPLEAFYGRTGFEMAQEGYLQHVSQHRYEQFQVEPRDSEQSSYHFGLARTRVGMDVYRNDFMENVLPDRYLVNQP